MSSEFFKKSLSYLSVALLVLFLIVAARSPSLAHGKEHKPDGEKSEHMQAMNAVKKDIPEEYRIMNRTPVMPDKESLQQGQKLFLQNCSVCHGDNGDGKGLAAAGLQTPPANFLDIKHSSIYGPGEKFWIIGHGTKATGMPEFSQLTSVERWHLVNHILQIQQKEPAK